MLRALLGILLTASTVQAQAISDMDHFALFNACRPMELVVETLTSDARAIGLTEERIRLAAESRMRAARLYTDSVEKANRASLYISIHVVGSAFHISVQYRRWVTDLANNSSGFASTWNANGTGYGGDAGYIMQNLPSYLDKFLAGYLRVNEPACDMR